MVNAPILTKVIEYDVDNFSWTAVIAGALVATATIFFLLALGAGFGLSITSAWEADTGTAKTMLTLGAIYFLAAQAFGFVIGGHLTGRLIGPLLERPAEERFHSIAHGLATWALCVVATGLIVTASGTFLGGSALNASAQVGAAAMESETTEDDINGYWVDMLFRPEAGAQPAAPAQPAATPEFQDPANPVFNVAPSAPIVPRDNEATRAEAGRILTMAAVPGTKLSPDDRSRLGSLVSEETGLSAEQAVQRVDAVETQMEQRALAAAEAARLTAQYIAFWTALALILGAACAAVAARMGREMDDQARGLTRA